MDPFSSPPIYTLASQLGEALRQRNWTVTTAESCTGGGVGYALTSVTGSSEWFETGFITYSNLSKTRQLGVSTQTLQRHGAVSAAVVEAMVAGALAASGAQIAVAISGVAGPGGGTVQKPAGTVWFGWGAYRGPVRAERHHFRGNRQRVRQLSVERALGGLLELLEEKPV